MFVEYIIYTNNSFIFYQTPQNINMKQAGIFDTDDE